MFGSIEQGMQIKCVQAGSSRRNTLCSRIVLWFTHLHWGSVHFEHKRKYVKIGHVQAVRGISSTILKLTSGNWQAVSVLPVSSVADVVTAQKTGFPNGLQTIWRSCFMLLKCALAISCHWVLLPAFVAMGVLGRLKGFHYKRSRCDILSYWFWSERCWFLSSLNPVTCALTWLLHCPFLPGWVFALLVPIFPK